MPETNEERDEETTTGEQLPTLSAADLTPAEAARFRAVLRLYFPAMDTDEDMSGGDAIEQLGELCRTLDGLGDFTATATAATE